ncbi:MAG: DNA polymerase III subunit delta, partial [Deltaproteobacteria bacterium]|nr:DNA polymerase III subunit delta [Deltaproteobacteria bacterium]
ETAIDPDAAELLADLMGVDLGGIDMALHKLVLYAAGATITSEHVEEAVAPTRVASVFELTDAVGRRDLAAASMTLRNALTGGESALLLLSMVARQLRHLIEVKELVAAGSQSHAMAQALGVRPFVVDKLVTQAKRYHMRELCVAVAAVHAADLRLKSSGLDPAVVLDRLLVDIVARPEARA